MRQRVDLTDKTIGTDHRIASLTGLSGRDVGGGGNPFVRHFVAAACLINGIKFDDALSRSVMPQRRNALCTEGWRKPSRNTVTKMPLSQIFGQLWKRDRHYERPGELGLHESGYRLAIANRTTMPGPAFVLSFKTSDIRPTFLSCRSALKKTKTYCSLCLKIIWSSIDTWKYPMLYDTFNQRVYTSQGKTVGKD